MHHISELFIFLKTHSGTLWDILKQPSVINLDILPNQRKNLPIMKESNIKDVRRCQNASPFIVYVIRVDMFYLE